MIPRPPTSTLFPYTTLFRSVIDTIKAGYTIPNTSTIVSGTARVGVQSGVNVAPIIDEPATGILSAPNRISLHVLGADDAGEENLTYHWTSGQSVSFSQTAGGSNADKDTVATVTAQGTYTFQVTITDSNGASVTSGAISVTVPDLSSSRVATSIVLTPSSK